ncbi:MAG: hypothetical protein IIX86_01150 [Clostridia bacterium]|nr:hypothetical protein [Clostridia bacterium]
MAKLKNFKGSVPISSGLCGIGGRDYPLVQAHDVQVDEDGTRLDEVLGNGGGGDNANFIFADSVEELPDPSTVPEDTVALVPSKGVTLTSPNGTIYRLTVSDDGVISATAVQSNT